MNNRIGIMFLPLLLATALVLDGCTKQTRSAPNTTPPSSAADVSSGLNATRTQTLRPAQKPVNSVTNSTSNSPSGGTLLRHLPSSVRGVYVTHDTFVKKSDGYWRDLKQRGVNALVIDIKNDSGYVYIDAKTKERVRHVENLGFYTIARMVAFKDPTACKWHPGWVLLRSRHWLDPANPQVQQYNLKIAGRAASLGIDEVQWDYVRYPDARISYSHSRRSQTISQFLAKSRSMLHQRNVLVSADVFGLVTTAKDDMGIGQLWESVSTSVDVLSPMVYPSHYGRGHYGLKSPVHAPSALISGAMKDAERRNAVLQKQGLSTAVLRPWLQDFDYKASYGPREIRAQIEANKRLGISSYLFWNAANVYTPRVSLR